MFFYFYFITWVSKFVQLFIFHFVKLNVKNKKNKTTLKKEKIIWKNKKK